MAYMTMYLVPTLFVLISLALSKISAGLGDPTPHPMGRRFVDDARATSLAWHVRSQLMQLLSTVQAVVRRAKRF